VIGVEVEPRPATPAPPVGTAGPVEVLVVVVNYRSAELAVDCLASLEPEVAANPGTRVAVVENASGADQAERIRDAIERRGWSGWASLIEAGRNGGFAAGNNAAIAPALAQPEPPEFVWLLNPDTVVRPGALAGLRDFLRRQPDVGMAGSRLENPDGTPQFSAFRFPSILGEVEGGLRFGPASRLLRDRAALMPIADSPGRVDWVAGASLMVRRAVFEAVGLLDEGYFMYYEEVDFCRRAAEAGWPCWYVPESRVVHLVGQSTGVNELRRRRPSYWFHARRRYFLKSQGRTKTFLADLAWALAYASYRVRRPIQGKPDGDPRWLLADFIRHNFLMPLVGR
jgi:N-acetylglucosaminyl-diphospho-decaprenol L-rhamnosyltransferase